MATRKSDTLPQRLAGDTSQAGCRGFESHRPLPEHRITTLFLGRSEMERLDSFPAWSRFAVGAQAVRAFAASRPQAVTATAGRFLPSGNQDRYVESVLVPMPSGWCHSMM
jgi:hypothetical protein